jgi:drug/metabolite transporter (DMT)-like permease
MVEPIVPGAAAPRAPNRLLGYAMVWAAATLFAVNGVVSKVILEAGLSSPRLAQVRSTGAVIGLGIFLLLVARASLRVSRRELPHLIALGVAGLAFVQWFYFVAINRLPIGIALLLQYLAPLLVALWARYALHERVRRRVWIALMGALLGLALVVHVWEGLALNGLGVAASLAAAVSFATYILLAERAVGRRDPISTAAYSFLFAAVFWAVVQPLWSFPWEIIGREVSLLGNLAGSELPVWALMAWVIVLGTITPFGLVVGSLRHVSATRVGIIAMLEPVLATLVAFAWLDERLDGPQVLGGAVVLCAILLAQTAR